MVHLLRSGRGRRGRVTAVIESCLLPAWLHPDCSFGRSHAAQIRRWSAHFLIRPGSDLARSWTATYLRSHHCTVVRCQRRPPRSSRWRCVSRRSRSSSTSPATAPTRSPRWSRMHSPTHSRSAVWCACRSWWAVARRCGRSTTMVSCASSPQPSAASDSPRTRALLSRSSALGSTSTNMIRART